MRIVVEHTDAAKRSLSAGTRIKDDDVHEARKAIKRARAAARLMRPALSRASFERVNYGLRDAARSLTTVRDAKVLLEALAFLRSGAGSANDSTFCAALERALKAERTRASRELRAAPRRIQSTRKALDRLAADVARWRPQSRGWAIIGAGFERTYRQGRRALKRAREQRTDEHLHEWRKQAKNLWHALQILEPLRPRRIGAMADRAHKLADHLGGDHDLAILRGKALATSGPADPKQIFIAALEERRADLQDRAFKLGEKLYARRPGRLREWMDRQWQPWDAQRAASDGEG